MPIIKRYNNRKLYDTRAKRYVTLMDVTAMIRHGDEVTVLDHATGEDITAQIQAQIIFEQQRQNGGSLPNNVLTNLIQASNQTLRQLRATLHPPEPNGSFDAEIERRIRLLVERGELSAKQASVLLEKLLAVRSPALSPQERELERALARRGTPTRTEIQELYAQLDELTRQVKALNPHSAKRKRPKADSARDT